MAKINMVFNDINYSIDESSFAAASATLKTHLSTTMSGSGSVVNFGGISYNIDSAKLADATNDFVSHLGTIAGSGSKVVVGGVEYSIDSDKVQNAVSGLETVLGNLNSPDDVKYYTITYYDDDGTTVLKTESLAYGAMPSYRPEKEGCVFSGWTPTPVAVTGETSYTASWVTAIASGTCGENATWLLTGSNELIISGTGAMADYSSSSQPWYDYAQQITTLTINNGITTIGAHAFRNLTGITEIYLPNSVITINTYAFYGCSAVTYISAYRLNTIGSSAFGGVKKCTTMGAFVLRYPVSTTMTYKSSNTSHPAITTTWASGSQEHWGLYKLTEYSTTIKYYQATWTRQT